MSGCDEALEHVDEYLAGTLDGPTTAGLEAHLAGCAECRTIVEDARFLQPLVAAMHREVEPPRDLWPAVRARIGAARRAWSVRPWGLALAASALLTFVALGVSLDLRAPAPEAPFQSSPARPPELVGFEGQVHVASAELEAAVHARERALDPETTATIAHNLAIIDAAIDESRQALDHSPDDPRIADALVSAHHQKIRLLRQVLWAPGAGE